MSARLLDRCAVPFKRSGLSGIFRKTGMAAAVGRCRPGAASSTGHAGSRRAARASFLRAPVAHVQRLSCSARVVHVQQRCASRASEREWSDQGAPQRAGATRVPTGGQLIANSGSLGFVWYFHPGATRRGAVGSFGFHGGTERRGARVRLAD
jgi:hypothetical protein